MDRDDQTQERAACPWCGEEIAKAAQVCRHCQRAPLWDLMLSAAVPERSSYHAARALEKELPTTFLELKEGFDAAPGVLWSGLVRERAEQLAELLGGLGVEVALRPGGEETAPPVGKRAGRRWSVAQLVAAGVLLLLVGLAGVAVLEKPDSGQQASPAVEALTTAQISRRFEQAAVHLQCSDRLGAGFFVTPELVVTNAHVLCDSPEIQVETVDGSVRTGRVVERDDDHDLAIIRVVAMGASPLPLGDVTALQRGDPVFAMGSPLGLDFTLSRGIVSHPDRVILGVSYVQIDASVHPGNSGGALVDGQGRAVAVVSMQVRGSSDLGFAVPVNYLYGRDKLLGERQPWFGAAAWSSRLAAAGAAEQAEIEEIRRQLDRPLLGGASLVPVGAVVAVVLRASDGPPSAESFQFALSVAGTKMCSPRGRGEEWQRWSSEGEGVDSRQSRWLAKHGLAAQLWATPVHLAMAGCPPPSQLVGAVLELDGAADSAAVATIERTR